jgi:hypothetical protein
MLCTSFTPAESRAMNHSSPSAQSATPPHAPGTVPYARGVFDEEDLALGLECAYPPLQIEVWSAEASAQPLQQVY